MSASGGQRGVARHGRRTAEVSLEGKAQIRALMARLGAERAAARLGCSPHTLADALDGFLRPHIAARIERELAQRGNGEQQCSRDPASASGAQK